MLETQSRALKTRILTRNQKYHEPKYWRVGSDDDIIKLTKKHIPVMIPVAQNPPPKLKIFFSILNYTTPQSLNSSLTQSADEL